MRTQKERKEYFKKYYQENKEKLKQYQKDYYDNKKGIVDKKIKVERGSFYISFS